VLPPVESYHIDVAGKNFNDRSGYAIASCHTLAWYGTVMPECYNGDVESERKSLKFDPYNHSKTPEPTVTKICIGDYVDT